VECPVSNDILCTEHRPVGNIHSTKYNQPYPSARAARNFHGTVLRCDRNFLGNNYRVAAFVYATKMIRCNFRYCCRNDSGCSANDEARQNLEHEAGIEPAMAVLQTANLPLVDSCKLGAAGRIRTCTLVRARGFKSRMAAFTSQRTFIHLCREPDRSCLGYPVLFRVAAEVECLRLND
jgi:hypothetical protein